MHRLLSESLSVGGIGDIVEDGRVKMTRVASFGASLQSRTRSFPRRSPFAARGLTVAAIFTAARRLASRAVCSGQTSVSSHATCEGSEASIGLRSNPARQTTCGAAVGNGVVSLAEHRKTGGSEAVAGARITLRP
jgi:hypothetical protein